ncbi:unnamed protein product [Brugia pahangi]|uniref:Conjugal transfer protein TraG n=1 Tax=Brugia pahangi TaxID=6280 RepID=A0A0N4TC33_BRUPA|nr:unnamed protein product [Brugia pahangi]
MLLLVRFAQPIVAYPLGSNFQPNLMLENDVNQAGSMKGSEMTRIRKNFPESWIWSATFAAE